MAQLASDTFDRADGGLGGNWTTTTGESAPSILSNAVHGASNVVSGARYSGIVWPNDQYASAILGLISVDTDNGAGVACRIASAANTCYLAQPNTVETRLYRNVGGTFAKLGNDGPPCAAGDLLELYCLGTYLTVWRNKVLIIAADDNNILSGDAGLFISLTSSDGQILDWIGGSVAGPVVPDYSMFPKAAVRR